MVHSKLLWSINDVMFHQAIARSKCMSDKNQYVYINIYLALLGYELKILGHSRSKSPPPDSRTDYCLELLSHLMEIWRNMILYIFGCINITREDSRYIQVSMTSVWACIEDFVRYLFMQLLNCLFSWESYLWRNLKLQILT